VNHLLDDFVAPAGRANGRNDLRVPYRSISHLATAYNAFTDAA
jgi:hypothetical protein